MKQLIPLMVEMVGRGEHFALATVVSRNGSAPRSSGAHVGAQG
jgi:xanthine/CO dehydrogenase XdhC/CoxF family maturation factor